MKSNHVQTFRAPSPREALELVKRHLGPDAVIVGTRSVPAQRSGSSTGRPGVEITAAPPEPRAGAVGTARHKAGADGSKPALPQHLYPHYVQLVQNEVAEELAVHLVQQAARQMPSRGNNDAHKLRDVVRRYIADLLPKHHSVALSPGQVRRVALVGPSGSGKTTTIAKLAARFSLREGRNVALLSLDMRRVGAQEQLRRFADIIGVPLHVAQTVTEARECLRGLESVDLLLIDTPGVGLREDGRFARLAAVLRAAQPDEVHLVLPASTAPEVLTRMAKGFAPLKPAGLVLTRLDDVVGFGVILDVVKRLQLRLSYLSTGQNVPQDIEEACGRRVAELVLPADRQLAGRPRSGR